MKEKPESPSEAPEDFHDSLTLAHIRDKQRRPRFMT